MKSLVDCSSPSTRFDGYDIEGDDYTTIAIPIITNYSYIQTLLYVYNYITITITVTVTIINQLLITVTSYLIFRQLKISTCTLDALCSVTIIVAIVLLHNFLQLGV